MKKIVLALTTLLISSIAFSQTTLSLLDGSQFKAKEYTFFNENNSSLEIKIEKKNGKLKTKYMDVNDMWSIGDSILYMPTEVEEFSVDEMRNVVLGKQYATSEFKPWWATAGGFVVGAGSMMIASRYGQMTIGLAGAIVYAGGISFVRPTKKSIQNKYPNYAENEYFVYGYQNKARRKVFINTIVGTISGVVVGGIASYFIPRTN